VKELEAVSALSQQPRFSTGRCLQQDADVPGFNDTAGCLTREYRQILRKVRKLAP